MRQSHRLTLFMLLAPLLFELMVTNVRAQNLPEHFEDSFIIDDIYCAFPVMVELNGKAKTIELTGGKTIFTSPGLVATFTNLAEPGKQEVLGITGAFHQSFLAYGETELVVTGRNLLIGFDQDVLFAVTIGNFRFVIDEEFNLIEPLTGKGQVIDVCRLLE